LCFSGQGWPQYRKKVGKENYSKNRRKGCKGEFTVLPQPRGGGMVKSGGVGQGETKNKGRTQAQSVGGVDLQKSGGVEREKGRD